MTGDAGAQVNKSDEIEEMLRSGKVVKIEPMPKPAVPLPQPSGILKCEMTREDRLKIAAKIVELSSMVLSKKENPHYIALKVGDGPYSNAVTVRWRTDRVSFHIPSTDLVKQAVAAGFSPENCESRRSFFEHKWYFNGLTLADLQKHEPLFSAIVKGSLEYIRSRRPKGK